MARPSKLTQELTDRIVLAIRAGNYSKVAAEMAGIGETTFYRWMELGAKEDATKQYREFRESIKRAEAEAEVRSVALIRQAADSGTWQAAAWYLERKHGDRWGRNDKIRQEVSGPDGKPVPLSLEEAKKAVLAFLEEGDNESLDSGAIPAEDTSGTQTLD